MKEIFMNIVRNSIPACHLTGYLQHSILGHWCLSSAQLSRISCEVGHLLFVPQELIPKTMKTAIYSFYLWLFLLWKCRRAERTCFDNKYESS